MAIQSKITVHKIAPHSGSKIDFGAEVRGADLETISQTDFEIIRKALYEHQVIIFKNQQHVAPVAQYELTRRFDPTVQAYGHGGAGWSLAFGSGRETMRLVDGILSGNNLRMSEPVLGSLY